jgi:hypothetical protein
MVNFDKLTGTKVDVADPGLFFGKKTLQPTPADTDYTYAGNVSLQQGVGSLRGAVSDKDNFLRLDFIFGKAFLKGLHNTGSYTALMVMSSHNRAFAHNFVCIIINGDSLSVSAANVNADANCSLHK